MSKTAAFVTGMAVITVLALLSIAFPERCEHVPAALAAAVSLCTAYIGLQVANNGVRGKFWNAELYGAEHGGHAGGGEDGA